MKGSINWEINLSLSPECFKAGFFFANIMTMGIPESRGVFCNRTLNFRGLRAIGYDLDYTLVDYNAEAFERKVFEFTIESFKREGWNLDDLTFDPLMISRGLVLDIEQGNIVKANRFGFVTKAMHGTKPLEYIEQKERYSHIQVDLSSNRWVFLNTLFSLSEGCIYARLVDRLDQGRLPKIIGYEELYRYVRSKVDLQHLEGRLKAEIRKDIETFVIRDPEAPLALLDQRISGKKLILITNSDWEYTKSLMKYSYEPFLLTGMDWRELFDLVIVSARKPEFFTSRAPFFQVVSEEGLLKPLNGPLQLGQAYVGGCAAQVELDLSISGDQILYVGDHMFGDVNVSKQLLHWRTCLILRELEGEIEALKSFKDHEKTLDLQMSEKVKLEGMISKLRLELQRSRHPIKNEFEIPDQLRCRKEPEILEEEIQSLRAKIAKIDETLAPLAKAANELTNPCWGLLMRAGNDKSHLARQVERYADIYTSRVSNFLYATPYAFLRSSRGDLPHDIQK